MKKIKFTFLLFVCGQIAFAQVSGNHRSARNEDDEYDYARRSRTVKPDPFNLVYLNDSAFVVKAKVLKNVKADSYVAVFGLNEEAASVTACNNKINDRIKSFISGLKKQGIKETDIYTDMLTQKRVYDIKPRVVNAVSKEQYPDKRYSEEGEMEEGEMEEEDRGRKYSYKKEEEYLKVFELSKNVIIKYSKPEQIEEFLSIASKDSIFDLVKVDYIINDVAKLYDELFVEVKEIIKKKKQMYVDLTDVKVKPAAQIYSENFNSYYPSELYDSYTAYVQNDYSTSGRYSEREIKRQHKFETFYYEKINYSSIDKIINPVILEPTIQVLLTVQVKYDVVK